jgi:hypothetical protein
MDKKNIDELLDTLGLIALYKSWLPWHLRGWVNALGLYVQERRVVQRSHLNAGGKFRSYLDAWREEGGDWQVRKFDENNWQLRFAHLVEPTCEIADFLNDRVHHFGDLDSDGTNALNKALLHYKSTGSWLGLPKVPVDTSLHRSANEGDTKTARLLVETGADVNARDNFERTPLRLAAEVGNTETARLLVESGADVNARDNFESTPLHAATTWGYKDMVELLRQYVARAGGEDEPA